LQKLAEEKPTTNVAWGGGKKEGRAMEGPKKFMGQQQKIADRQRGEGGKGPGQRGLFSEGRRKENFPLKKEKKTPPNAGAAKRGEKSKESKSSWSNGGGRQDKRRKKGGRS